MDEQGKLLLLLYLLFFSAPSGRAICKVDGARNGVKKLFVFGDSYADSGNWDKSESPSWKAPYGITYPGQPAGRYSNGQILIDYIASHYGIASPMPYERRTSGGTEFGINFAYGGAGVLDTIYHIPNITTQIDFLQQLIVDARFFTPTELVTSFAVFFLSGNDYLTYLRHGGSIKGFPEFCKSVVKQLVMDIKRIHDLGVPKVAVGAMEPLGCLPLFTADYSYEACYREANAVARLHNQLLMQSLDKLNSRSREPVFLILDLYDAFMSSIRGDKIQPGRGNFDYEERLKPCCEGVASEYECGSKDGEEAKYSVCKNPESWFFWDGAHPTQQGWYGVYLAIKSSLPRLDEDREGLKGTYLIAGLAGDEL